MLRFLKPYLVILPLSLAMIGCGKGKDTVTSPEPPMSITQATEVAKQLLEIWTLLPIPKAFLWGCFSFSPYLMTTWIP